ncbi:deformed epidermal autoregulatory factor 1 [Anaeramoeba flamelloides]|uniref:Deformed epidermal autoregulatory factor 1 n=1 Tax=Anaeramoeba flamelloides TaxID=1746091 RepID=A0ABQ8XMD7_9EUKA|nr:deformed epidermal autoregulatory factor 1 [Anaeramoeba flamelloides]
MSNNTKQRGKRSNPTILTTWDSPFIVQKTKYTGILADLLTLGDPHKVNPKKSKVYSKMKWSFHDIDKLSKFSRDYRLHFEVKKNNPEYYATIHALIIIKLIVKRTIEQENNEKTNKNNNKKTIMIFERNSDGCIKFLEPLIPIIGIFDFENEDFIDEFIQICKYSGDSLLPYLIEYVKKKKGRGLSYAFQAIHNLGCYWTTKPEIRKKVIAALNKLIESPENETPQFNSYVIDSLLECNAVESYHLIKRCYKLKCVDESFVEWERVKSTLDIDLNSTIENNTLSRSSDEEENSENENENENESKTNFLKNKKKNSKKANLKNKFLEENSKNNEAIENKNKKKNENENENENKNKNDQEETESKKQKEQILEKREINQRLINEKFLKERERDLKEKELKIKKLHREFENKIQFFHQQRKSQNENHLLTENEEYKKNVEKWILQLQEEDGDFDLSVDTELKECSFCKKKESKSNEFLVCKRCMMAERIVPYCSKECQKRHWDSHKKTCGQEFIKYWVHPRKKFSATYFPLKD